MKLMVQNFEEVKSNSYNYDVNTVVIMDRLKYVHYVFKIAYYSFQ